MDPVEHPSALLAVAVEVVTAAQPAAALEQLARALVERTGYRAAIARLLDPERGELDVVAAWGLSESYLAKGAVTRPQSALDARVLDGTVVALRDVCSDPAFQYGEVARREGLASVLAAPIVIHGRPMGVLRVYTGAPRDFSDEERATLAALATLCGEAFGRAHRGKALESIMRDVGATLEGREIIDRLLDHTVGGLGFSGASLRLIDEEDGTLVLGGSRGLSTEYLRAGDRLVTHPVDRRVLDGETIVIGDLQRQFGLPYSRAALAEGIRSVLSVPLRARGRAIGLLRVYSRQVRRFTTAEVVFVQLVAELGALALDNARLYHALEERVEELDEEASGFFRFLALS
jgi:GAF domain-containing protein